MDGIQSTGTKYIQYGSRTFLNISGQMSKVEEPVNMDKMSAYAPSAAERRQAWRPYFQSGTLRSSAAVSDVYRDIDTQMNDAVDRFLDGNMTEGELSETFQSMLSRLSDACEERGYPTPLGAGVDGEQAMADCMFSDFRQRVLDEAVRRNNQEGLQYASNGRDGHWQYYNSDYYYKTESAISALKDGVMDFCHDKGYADFSLTPRGKEWKLELVGHHYYDDFNSAWEHSFGTSQTFLNNKQAPPKDFVWFYETGGTGKIYAYENKAPDSTKFDPADPRSARMWASYRDAAGKHQRAEKAFVFDGSRADLKSVTALLAIGGGDSMLNRFLQNLRVFSGGYFSKYPAKTVDFRA